MHVHTCRTFGEATGDVCSIPFAQTHFHTVDDEGNWDVLIGEHIEGANPTSDEDTDEFIFFTEETQWCYPEDTLEQSMLRLEDLEAVRTRVHALPPLGLAQVGAWPIVSFYGTREDLERFLETWEGDGPAIRDD